MPGPNIDRVKRVLESREPKLYEIHAGGWDHWMRSSEFGRCRRMGTRASIVWEGTTELAIQAYENDAGVHVLHHHDTYSYVFDDEILGRFKKGNEDGFTAKYPTQLSMLFHEPEVDLFGYCDLERVEFVYKLNKLQTAMDDAFVVGRDGDAVAWMYPMRRGPSATIIDFRPRPLLPSGSSGEIATVKPNELPKQTDTDKNDE
jgi:hypothetical protein